MTTAAKRRGTPPFHHFFSVTTREMLIRKESEFYLKCRKMENRCSLCDVPIRPDEARKIRRETGGRLICRKCMTEKGISKKTSTLLCDRCESPLSGERIRIINQARERGESPPRLCEECVSKIDPKLPGKRLHE